jgi:hypothetical protein
VTKFETASADSGASLSRPELVARGGTIAPSASASGAGVEVGAKSGTASTVFARRRSARLSVWNGAVNGDRMRATSQVAHSLVSTAFR